MEDGPPYAIEKYFMPETKEAKTFLESLPRGSYSAEKVYEKSLLSVILDTLFLLDRDQMLEAFKKLICDYSGSMEGALDFLEKFVDQGPLRKRIITLKLIKAQLMLAKGEQEECIKLLESLKENAETEKERFYATMFLLRTSSDKKEALETEKLSKKERALIENERGKALWNADKYLEAKKRFENFLNLADDDFLKSIAYNNIGLSAGCMGDYQCALEMLERSLNLCEKMGDRCGSLRARLNIGEMLKEMGMLAEAERMLLSVLNEARIVNTPFGAGVRADCCITLAEIEILRNNSERALELCNSAYEEQCGDRTVELRALIIRARADVIGNNIDEAKSLIERAITLAEELSSKRYEASAYLVKGMIHEREGDYKDALQSYGLAIFFFRKINNLYGAANAEERIGRLYENSKEKDKAEEHKKRARELLESFRALRE